MNKWKYKLSVWMQGRYGMDPLYKGILFLYIGLLIINMFIRSSLVMTVSMLLLVFAMFRVFSKQTAKRAAENQRYLSFIGPLKKKALQSINRVKEYKTHRYRSCPSCHTSLRLKKKIGTTTITCPKCHSTFQVTIKR